jgi:hypothetical protein
MEDVRARRWQLRRRGCDGKLVVDPDVRRGRRPEADAVRELERLGLELVELRQLQLRFVVEQQQLQQQFQQQQQ